MINENTYLSKIIDVFIFIKDLENTVTENYIVQRANLSKEGIQDLIVDPKLWKKGLLPSREKIEEISNQVYKINYAKIKNYKKWILGYGLVLLCGIFDDFLIKILDEILEENQNFTKWKDKNEILAGFKEGTIKEKFNIFIKKLNFTEEEFFDFGFFVSDIQKKFKGFKFLDLQKIYKNRNIAAHTDSYVIYTIDELIYIRELFEKLIWNLSIKSRQKWNIKSEIIELIRKDEA